MHKLSAIEEWLKAAFGQQECLKELYIIGSILTDVESANDVDIIQKISFVKGDVIDAYLKNLKNIKEEFYNTFFRSLHITTFTQNENSEFERFISLNEHLKIL